MSDMVVEQFPIMKGDAAMARGASYFEVPLFSHIIDDLWMGCSPAEFHDGYKWLLQDVVGEEIPRPRFNVIFNLYRWVAYLHPRATEMRTYTMFDGMRVDEDTVDVVVDDVINALNKGYRVLVHCQAGLNRSSLVVARVLMRHYSMNAYQAIEHIRNQRSPMCLCNENFESYLRSLDG